MSLTTTAPLVLPSRSQSMSYSSDERPYSSAGHAPPPVPQGGLYFARPASSHGAPPSSSHGIPPPSPYSQPHPSLPDPLSPERLHSSHGYTKSIPQTPTYVHARAQDMPQSSGSTHAYPATPITGPSYPAHPPSEGYYGAVQTPTDPNMPSPPQTSDGRTPAHNFTMDGNPIVPVGISGGKMFQCRGYGECDKVFTRSEHLARHVRKHTGERPFPCHCGKAFSRLDNLRQHAATVHADQTPLNDAMLNSLSPVHAALSARATKEQRKRGEVVEVPKNAVERPRHNETFRVKEDSGTPTVTAAAYPPYSEETTPTWDQHTRPRTGTSGGYEYPFHAALEAIPAPIPMTDPGSAGPSRRPGSSASVTAGYQGYNMGYYEPLPPHRPTTSEANSSADSLAHLQYAYRPAPSTGREMPLQPHYAESEPPSSAHGPPQSPMYAAPPPVPHPIWSSPPPPHPGYAQPHLHGHGHGHAHEPAHRNMFNPAPTPEGYRYPDDTGSHHTPTTAGAPSLPHSYGPPPPSSAGSAYGYHQANPGYYGPTSQYTPALPPPPPLLPHQHQQAPNFQIPHPPATSISHPGLGQYQSATPHPLPAPQQPISPFQYHGTSDSSISTHPHPQAHSAVQAPSSAGSVPGQGEYQYPTPYTQPAPHSGQKRRAEELDTSPDIINAMNPSVRKGPRSSVLMNQIQPIRALQDTTPTTDDNELWFPPTTERRSSLAISALLGSPQMDHKPRPPFGDMSNNGSAVAAGLGGPGGSGLGISVGGEMEEKAKALLGSAH